VEQVIGFSKTKTSSILSGMVDEGILKRIGNGRSVLYTLSG
jgi:predicted transcriptional regulator of viral defense system